MPSPFSYPASLFIFSLHCLALCLSVIHWLAAPSPAGWPYGGGRSEIKGHLWLQRGLPCHRRGLRQPLRYLHPLSCKRRAFSCVCVCELFVNLHWIIFWSLGTRCKLNFSPPVFLKMHHAQVPLYYLRISCPAKISSDSYYPMRHSVTFDNLFDWFTVVQEKGWWLFFFKLFFKLWNCFHYRT